MVVHPVEVDSRLGLALLNLLEGLEGSPPVVEPIPACAKIFFGDGNGCCASDYDYDLVSAIDYVGILTPRLAVVDMRRLVPVRAAPAVHRPLQVPEVPALVAHQAFEGCL